MVRAATITAAFLLASSCGMGEEPFTYERAEIASVEQAVRAASTAPYRLRVTDSRTQKRHFADHYAIEELDSLYFALEVPDLPGRHTATLIVYSDGEMPYASYDVAYVVGEEPREGELRALRGERDERRVWITAMPVAGTWIQQYGLTGAWRAEAFVDDGVVGPISTSFTLE